MSDAATPYDHIRAASKSGKMGQTLIAIVGEGARGRADVEPVPEHEAIARSAKPSRELDTKLPANPRDFKTPNYGLTTFGDLFTDRQLVALKTFSDLVHEAREKTEADALAAGLSPDPTPLREGVTGAKADAEAVSVYLAFAITRLADRGSRFRLGAGQRTLPWAFAIARRADRGSTISGWDLSRTTIRNTYTRQAIPLTWHFAEGNPFSTFTGNWLLFRDRIRKALSELPCSALGKASQLDAQTVTYPQAALIATAPLLRQRRLCQLVRFFQLLAETGVEARFSRAFWNSPYAQNRRACCHPLSAWQRCGG